MDPADPSARPARPVRGFLPGVIALIALLLIGLLWGAGDLLHTADTTLAGPDTADQIALGIQAQQNLAQAPAVTCPAREPVRAGYTFDCTLVGHPPRTIHVTEIDARGEVRWSLGAGT
ncbi:MAG: DUF4333 domain-containing protein [Acidobacteriota bacterium]|nr:DUF4333 domain-containing protein [Acidobacteriota bacterium]